MDFTYEQHTNRVVFGVGSRRKVPAEVAGLGASKVFLIADHAAMSVGEEIRAALGHAVVATWTDVVQHVPVDLAERARAAVTTSGADVVVSVGGGSATGLAKAIALSHRLPIVAVPTTYAGSEQTPIYGMTGGRHKATGRDPIVVPRVVVYDPELTVGLPAGVTGPSAFNALAHSVEALYSTGANPVTTALALEGICSIHDHLGGAISNGADLVARSGVLYGAYLSGMALGTTSAGLHHKICHVLGGTFNLVHADAHSVILPHVTSFNRTAVADMLRLELALGNPGVDPGIALWELARSTGVPTTLEELGLRAEDLPEAASRVFAELPPNPRPVTEVDLLILLQAAFAGTRPGTH
jgi:maleylacetate reductase